MTGWDECIKDESLHGALQSSISTLTEGPMARYGASKPRRLSLAYAEFGSLSRIGQGTIKLFTSAN